MAVPLNKTELLNAINVNFDKLVRELENVPSGLLSECSMEGHAKGTKINVANLVAYLVGWNELVLKWLERDAAGEPIDFPDTGYKWNELGRLAQKFYHDYDSLRYPQLLERLRGAKGRIVSYIDLHDNAHLYERSWYEKWTMGRMIQFNTSSPYENARGRLRKWRKSKAV
ncbi:ClbS/DfsB family four-helix bundle protein [Ensifer sp. ENS06]|uniref:ClbS/DfsB family four-helix bundle protein n=1 Tax=Ensifer sp. ENS06 TaxID=2769276 RepID=UPI00177FF4D5|nr:ClbS/DfsB family four-helix bundle protein [Ensifer sp. ENS06]MBD9627004.1 ClbS/DfsB family four-helix bundle protein [Ensifer sp. ENS06]